MFRIRRMGMNGWHDGSFRINRENGYDCYLLLFIKTRARFVIQGKEIISEPNSFIVWNVNSPQLYGAYEKEYVNHWIQFEDNRDGSIGRELVVPTDTIISVGKSVRVDDYISLIYDNFFTDNQYVYTMLIQAMFTEISGLITRPDNCSVHSASLVDLRKDIYEHPEAKWKIEYMADRVHVSPAYFQELYKGTFGISCGVDVINARIEMAKSLLFETDLSASEIGYLCGYHSPVHFSRQFKQVVGVAPIEWRKGCKVLVI